MFGPQASPEGTDGQGACETLLLQDKSVMPNCYVKVSPHGDIHDEQEGSAPGGPGLRALAGRITNQQGATALHLSVRQFHRLKKRFARDGPRVCCIAAAGGRPRAASTRTCGSVSAPSSSRPTRPQRCPPHREVAGG